MWYPLNKQILKQLESSIICLLSDKWRMLSDWMPSDRHTPVQHYWLTLSHRGRLSSAAALTIRPLEDQRWNETVPPILNHNSHTDSEAEYHCKIPALKRQCEWSFWLLKGLTHKDEDAKYVIGGITCGFSVVCLIFLYILPPRGVGHYVSFQHSYREPSD